MANSKNTAASAPSPTGIYAHVVGWGMAVPDNVMTNDDLAAFIDTSDEWIRARTGIRERHIATERDSTASLGLRAAQQALDVADILPIELDLVIVATSTPENIFPSTASLIQDQLGASKAGAFDLSAACSGFVYGVQMGTQAIRAGSAQTVLVIGAETMSRVMNWNDRGTCILFGDGAGAVVLRASNEEGGVLSAVLRSDGSGGDLLGIPTVGSIDALVAKAGLENGHNMLKMHMNGGEVFKFATRVIGDSILQAAEQAGITLNDIRLIIPHQANERIIQAAARHLKLDPSRFMMNVDRYGNTSAASIPIAIAEAVKEGRIKEDDHVALVGFGGGLTWASMVIKWGVPHAQEAAILKKQRREFSYVLARWRAALRRLSRRINEAFQVFRPAQGRLSRLRRKIDNTPLL
ncbi:MAG: beta-ketoacyl-ACP synthase III [Anaerolineae bacterium]